MINKNEENYKFSLCKGKFLYIVFPPTRYCWVFNHRKSSLQFIDSFQELITLKNISIDLFFSLSFIQSYLASLISLLLFCILNTIELSSPFFYFSLCNVFFKLSIIFFCEPSLDLTVSSCFFLLL